MSGGVNGASLATGSAAGSDTVALPVAADSH